MDESSRNLIFKSDGEPGAGANGESRADGEPTTDADGEPNAVPDGSSRRCGSTHGCRSFWTDVSNGKLRMGHGIV